MLPYVTRTPVDKIIGTTVQKVYAEEDCITIVVEGGCFVLTLGADCCSHSYWEGVVGANNLIGQKITEIRDSGDGPSGFIYRTGTQECDSYYGVALVTESGEVAFFQYINSSNGYYGGWLEAMFYNTNPQRIHGDDISNESNWIS